MFIAAKAICSTTSAYSSGWIPQVIHRQLLNKIARTLSSVDTSSEQLTHQAKSTVTAIAGHWRNSNIKLNRRAFKLRRSCGAIVSHRTDRNCPDSSERRIWLLQTRRLDSPAALRRSAYFSLYAGRTPTKPQLSQPVGNTRLAQSRLGSAFFPDRWVL